MVRNRFLIFIEGNNWNWWEMEMFVPTLWPVNKIEVEIENGIFCLFLALNLHGQVSTLFLITIVTSHIFHLTTDQNWPFPPLFGFLFSLTGLPQITSTIDNKWLIPERHNCDSKRKRPPHVRLCLKSQELTFTCKFSFPTVTRARLFQGRSYGNGRCRGGHLGKQGALS